MFTTNNSGGLVHCAESVGYLLRAAGSLTQVEVERLKQGFDRCGPERSADFVFLRLTGAIRGAIAPSIALPPHDGVVHHSRQSSSSP